MPTPRSSVASRSVIPQSTSSVQMIPLGGEREIGKNTWAFRYEDDIILLDAGLAFPDESMHGVNIVLPDMTYIKQNRDKVRGMVVTHGHEDHIGGIPYHLREFDIPVIYGPRLALALLEEKLREVGLLNRTELRPVGPREIVPLSKHFFAEFIRNTHSFADSFTVALHTPVGVIIQTGDFKIDHTPVDGEYFDLQRLAEHGEKGVLCLISDSTNAEVPGFTPSEASVVPGLTKAIAGAKGTGDHHYLCFFGTSSQLGAADCRTARSGGVSAGPLHAECGGSRAAFGLHPLQGRNAAADACDQQPAG
jgi:ribonuclease J